MPNLGWGSPKRSTVWGGVQWHNHNHLTVYPISSYETNYQEPKYLPPSGMVTVCEAYFVFICNKVYIHIKVNLCTCLIDGHDLTANIKGTC